MGVEYDQGQAVARYSERADSAVDLPEREIPAALWVLDEELSQLERVVREMTDRLAKAGLLETVEDETGVRPSDPYPGSAAQFANELRARAYRVSEARKDLVAALDRLAI